MAQKKVLTEGDTSPRISSALASAVFQPGAFVPAEHGLQVADHDLKLQEGQTLVGKYLGTGPSRIFEKDDGTKEETKTHRFELNDGGTVLLGGKAILDSKLEGVTIGSVIGVQYLGMGKGKRGHGQAP